MANQDLIITLAFVALVTGLVLLVNWATNRLIPGLLNLALGTLCTSLGILLITMQNELTPFISVLFANFLIMGGRIPFLIGLCSFWNQEKSKLPIVLGFLLFIVLLVFYYFTFIDDSMYWRSWAFTLFMGASRLSFVFILINGLKIERRLRPAVALSASYGAYLLIVLFSFNVVAETFLMFFSSGAAIGDADPSNSRLLISSTVTLAIVTFGIIIMTMEEMTAEHHENAIYDPITTVLNSRTLGEVGNRILGIALRYSKPVSLLTIEITNFEDVVKTHGIKVGNKLLHHFALMANDRRRHEDVLARSGPKTFRVVLTGVDEAGAEVVLRKIRNSLSAEEFVYRGNNIRVRVAVSVITRREDDLHLQQMLQDGDVELLNAKTEALANS